MAGNTRGKLKEAYEGMHRNLDWIIVHVNKCLALIGDENHELYKGTKTIGEAAQTLDDIAKEIYSKI